MADSTKSAEVRRILDRYVIEVVERYDLCPWARTARIDHEVAIEIVFGTPTIDEWFAACRRALESPRVRVAMIVAPELVIDPPALRAVRDQVVTSMPAIGVADFHPRACLDLATPARLVPYLRRSPDPLLQLVPLALLEHVRSSTPPDRAAQLQILGGYVTAPRDVAAQIAAANHVRVSAKHEEIERTLAAIAEDRATAYARVGLSASR